MLVLSGKKISNVLLGVFVLLLLVTITLDSKSESEEYISTVSLPVSGKVVVVDAGHGIPDEGDFELKL